MKELIDQPDPVFGCDCFWVRFDPYRRILHAAGAVGGTVAAKAVRSFSFRIEGPDLLADRRYVLAAEVVRDGVDHGEKAEMIIDVE